MKRFVIGILAHVDSGKTTLSEAVLYRAGALKKPGRVDHGDAFLDTHALERDRGITIFSKQAVLPLAQDLEITLVDTPGHVDFSPEAERTLAVLDYAVLVISGTDGVQSHTETLWRLLQDYQVPVFVFVNKMDLAGAEKTAVMQSLHNRLGDGFVDFTQTQTDSFYEAASLCDESVMNEYLAQGKVKQEALADAVRKRHIFPCYFGSALRLDGVDALLTGIRQYAKPPAYGQEFGARIYKITHDEQGNRLTHLKITGGSLKVRSNIAELDAEGEQTEEKINGIRIYSGGKFQNTQEAFAGEVCAVTGLNFTHAGEGIGIEAEGQAARLEPVLNYRVILPQGTDEHTGLLRLRELEEEDPQLHVTWNERLREIQVQLMGEVQLQILKSIVRERFGMDVQFGTGNIVYKETIKNKVEGVGHFEPLRHYAEVHLLLEPGKQGSGLVLQSKCSEDMLDKNWQRLILTHLEEKTHLGVLTGSPITDMRITLVSGRAHLKHTEGGDFRQATYRAVRQGLMQAESVLLEPYYHFTITLPAELVGRAISDLQHRSAQFSPPQMQGESAIITGSAPVAEMREYQTTLTNYTRGAGRLVCSFEGYEPCHNAEEVCRAIDYHAESDLENTPDSVFCAHGAGFPVKWNQVKEKMHLESCLKQKGEEPLAPVAPKQNVAAYCNTIEQDKELMAIFERTYGPIKRDKRMALHRQAQTYSPAAPVKKSGVITTGEQYLIVDGYNIIYAWESLRKLSEQSLDLARETLIAKLCNYQGVTHNRVILVFDAYKVKENPGSIEQFRNISVVYTKEAETADSYIEKVSHELAKQYRVTVATSDGAEQLVILGNGALRMTAAEFQQKLEQVEQTIKEYLTEL